MKFNTRFLRTRLQILDLNQGTVEHTLGCTQDILARYFASIIEIQQERTKGSVGVFFEIRCPELLEKIIQIIPVRGFGEAMKELIELPEFKAYPDAWYQIT